MRDGVATPTRPAKTCIECGMKHCSIKYDDFCDKCFEGAFPQAVRSGSSSSSSSSIHFGQTGGGSSGGATTKTARKRSAGAGESAGESNKKKKKEERKKERRSAAAQSHTALRNCKDCGLKIPASHMRASWGLSESCQPRRRMDAIAKVGWYK